MIPIDHFADFGQAHRMSPERPIVSLTTDFGVSDYYVAALKAVLLRHVPDAQLIDNTHGIGPQDLVAGTIALERAVSIFSPQTVHLAVVDPGVGTERRILLAQVRGQWVVCPDNGLITWTIHRQGGDGDRFFELLWRPQQVSSTFHGRDIMAPAAGMLAAGRDVRTLGRIIVDPVLLNLAPAEPNATMAQIIHFDHFGNASTNMPADHPRLQTARYVAVNGQDLGPLCRTYGDVPDGCPLALIGSSGLLEIAVRNGSAREQLDLALGGAVEVR